MSLNRHMAQRSVVDDRLLCVWSFSLFVCVSLNRHMAQRSLVDEWFMSLVVQFVCLYEFEQTHGTEVAC